MVYSKNTNTLIIKYFWFTFSLHLFTFNIFTPNPDLINKINYIFAQHKHDMGRPKITDKIRQIPVGIRQSVIEKYGYDNLQDQIKQFIKKFN